MNNMYITLFFTFVKIGMFTIGGGYAMIPLIERELIKRQWMTQEEFLEMLALAQSLPGVFAVNISIFVGFRIRKLWGSVVCALGCIIPSFVIILLIAMFFNQFQDNPVVMSIFKGIRPAVVALIVIPCLSAIKSIKLGYVGMIAPTLGALLIWKMGVSPVYIVLAGIVGGLLYTLWIKDKLKPNREL